MAPYVDLEGRCARLDARRTSYRFDLEADVPWASLDGPGDHFGPALLRSLGVDAGALGLLPAAQRHLQWALALSSCRAFQLLEELILRFAAREQERLGPTRSVTLLVEEEEKHIRLFERYGAHLAARPPDAGALARLEPHLAASAARVRRLAEEDAPPAPRDAHWAFWFNTLVFEEYTVHLHDRLEAEAGSLHAGWVRAHEMHRREEAQHVVTDAAHLEAIDAGEDERAALSKLCWIGLARHFWDFVGLAPARDATAEAFPGAAAALGSASLEETPLFADILERPAFKRTRAASPHLASLARERAGRSAPAAAPGSALALVRSLVAETFAIPAESVGADLPFTALGVDSLRAAALHGRLEARLGRKIDLLRFLGSRTPRALAASLEEPPRNRISAPSTPAGLRPPSAQGERREKDIAVVAMSCRLPGAPDLDSFWRMLVEGRDAISDVPPSRFDRARYASDDAREPGRTVCTRGGFLDDALVQGFDAEAFGLDAREAREMDPQHRIFLEVAGEALEAAGFPSGRVGVFATAGGNQVLPRLLEDEERIGPLSAAAHLPHMVAARVAQVFRLRGPAVAVEAACASSLVAVHMACEALQRGECDVAVAGGVELNLTAAPYLLFSQAGVLSAEGRARPFDRRASGLVPGEGAGAVVLAPLEAALREGRRVIGVIRGGAVNNDGGALSLLAPNPAGQRDVVRRALESAGVDARTISLVEAHAAGTPVGDPIEARSLSEALGAAPRGSIALGSVKSNLGHLFHAAGIASLLKVLLSLERGVMPPCAGLDEPDPRIAFEETPLVPSQRARPWPRREGAPRRAGVSAFGIGGTNCHLVLEEAPPLDAMPVARGGEGPWLLALAAPSAEALVREGRSLAGAISGAPSQDVGAFAAAVCVRARRLPEAKVRAAIVVDDARDAAARLAAIAPAAVPPRAARTALVFGAPGSQYAGMARGLYEREPAFREGLDRSLAALARHADLPARAALLEGDEGREAALLERIDVQQVTVFAFGAALLGWLEALGLRADAFLGHSGGEVVAAVASGHLSLEEGARLAALRGRVMAAATAARPGRMAAVFAPRDEVARHVAARASAASIAAVNEPDQCVISGEAGAVDAILAALAAEGIGSRPLVIGCAAHSPLMAPAGDEVAAALARAPLAAGAAGRAPLFSTVTGARVEGALLGEHWRLQMTAPVRFADAVRAAADAGIDVFVEVAATAALSPCMERTLEGRGAEVLPLLRRSALGRAAPLAALGRLFERGVPLALERLEDARPAAYPLLPPYAYARRRLWIDAPAVLSWEGEPSARDHVARGRAIAPAARLIELALLATEGERGPGGGLGEVLVVEPLPLAKGAPREVAARAQGPLAARRASVASRPAGGGGAWTAHLRAAVLEGGEADPGAAPPPPLDLAAIGARCREEIDPAALYAHTARNGLAHGPHMRRVRSLARGDGEVLARLEAAPGAPPTAFDPALVDGAMQAIGGLTVGGDGGAPATYLGFAYREVRAWAPLAGPCLAHVRHLGGLSPGAESFRVDVAIADLEGRVLVAMREVALKRSHAAWTEERVAPAAAFASEAPLRAYAVEWEPAPIAPGPSTSGALRSPEAPGDRGGEDSAVPASASPPAVVLGGPERPFPRDDGALADLLRASLAGEGPAPRLVLLEPRLDDLARLPRGLDAAPRAPSEILVLSSDPAVMGLLRVLPQEEPGLALRGVEVEAEAGPLALAEALLQEVSAPGGPLHVARRGGARKAPVLRALGPPAGPSLLRPGAALWITGGAGAVGLALAETLARTMCCRLLLTGRRPSLDAEARARLDAAGARWLYVKADAASPREMARAYEEGRARLGPLEGAIHAAGVIDDRPLRATASGDLERALRPKREGARVLIDMATRGGLAFVALMGSLTARVGGPGQGAYAAANAALSGIAERARPGGPRVVALDWGPFRIGMAGAPEHQARYEALGLRPHSIERAARALVDALAHDAAEVMLLDHEEGLERRLEEAIRGGASARLPRAQDTPSAHPERSAAEGGTQSKGGLVARPSTGPAREQMNAAPSTPGALRAPYAQGERMEGTGEPGNVEFVTDFLSRRLRKPASAIDPRAAFSRMGVDSLMAVELVKSLERRTGRRLYPTLLFEVPTIEALAAFLERQGASA